jgi:hypothetical protein
VVTDEKIQMDLDETSLSDIADKMVILLIGAEVLIDDIASQFDFHISI